MNSPYVGNNGTVDANRSKREAPGPHFEKVAKVWSVIIGSSISPEQVLLCMAALKIVRQAGQHDPDNAVDTAGYMSMIDEVRSWKSGQGVCRDEHGADLLLKSVRADPLYATFSTAMSPAEIQRNAERGEPDLYPPGGWGLRK